jgi:hypothetical protein
MDHDSVLEQPAPRRPAPTVRAVLFHTGLWAAVALVAYLAWQA